VRNTRKTGRISALCAILPALWEDTLVPGIVGEELTRNGADIRSISCLAVREPSDVKAVQRLQAELDPGESAAIAFALEVGADLILADERKGGRKRRKWVWRLSDCSVARRNAAD